MAIKRTTWEKQSNILLWSSNLWAFADGMFGPLFVIFANKVGGDILNITTAYATYLIMTGIGVIIVGKISDIYNKKKILVAGYFLNAALTFCYLFVHTPMQLLLIQAGLGLALALANPTWNALFYENTSEEKAGTAYGLSDGLHDIGAGIALIIGGFIVSYYGFAVLFLIMGTVQTIAAFYQASILMKEHNV